MSSPQPDSVELKVRKETSLRWVKTLKDYHVMQEEMHQHWKKQSPRGDPFAYGPKEGAANVAPTGQAKEKISKRTA